MPIRLKAFNLTAQGKMKNKPSQSPERALYFALSGLDGLRESDAQGYIVRLTPKPCINRSNPFSA